MCQLPKSFTKRNGLPHIPYREWVIVNTSHKASKVKNKLQLKNEKERVSLQWLLNHKINLACLSRSQCLHFQKPGMMRNMQLPAVLRVSEWNCVIEALVSDLVKVSFEQIFLMTCFKWRTKVYFIQVYRPVKQLVKQDLLERTALQIATQFWD